MIIRPYFYRENGGEDIFSRLLTERVIMVFGEIDEDMAATVIAQLLYLESMDSSKDIQMYINSPGGSVSAGLAIYDTMRHIHCDVATICVGMAASMGAFLLAGGTQGKRYCLENGEVMIHQLLGGVGGQATDIMIEADHMKSLKGRMNAILARNTGHTQEEIEKATDRNNWMYAEEAKAFGIIDTVLTEEDKR